MALETVDVELPCEPPTLTVSAEGVRDDKTILKAKIVRALAQAWLEAAQGIENEASGRGGTMTEAQGRELDEMKRKGERALDEALVQSFKASVLQTPG